MVNAPVYGGLCQAGFSTCVLPPEQSGEAGLAPTSQTVRPPSVRMSGSDPPTPQSESALESLRIRMLSPHSRPLPLPPPRQPLGVILRRSHGGDGSGALLVNCPCKPRSPCPLGTSCSANSPCGTSTGPQSTYCGIRGAGGTRKLCVTVSAMGDTPASVTGVGVPACPPPGRGLLVIAQCWGDGQARAWHSDQRDEDRDRYTAGSGLRSPVSPHLTSVSKLCNFKWNNV